MLGARNTGRSSSYTIQGVIKEVMREEGEDKMDEEATVDVGRRDSCSGGGGSKVDVSWGILPHRCIEVRGACGNIHAPVHFTTRHSQHW